MRSRAPNRRPLLRRLQGAVLLVVLAGCEGEPKREPPVELAVDVFSDTSRSIPLVATSVPRARVWIERVMPAKPSAVAEPELPDAPSAAPDWDPAPAPESVPGLQPPILRRGTPLVLPPAGQKGRGSVELDVRVDDGGEVTEVRYAGGMHDSAWVRAASRCARAMRFYPALLEGRPVAVWCRQRFDFGVR